MTLFIVWRDSRRADITYTIGAAPLDPTAAIEITGTPRRTFELPRLPVSTSGEV